MDNLLEIGLILFTAIVVRATFGFGDALIAMPLLTLILGIQVAAPLFALVSFGVGLVILLTSWSDVDFKSAWQLILASVSGIVLGVMLLKNAPEQIVMMALGVFLILFGCYRLLQPELPELKNQSWVYLFGFISGILGGAYNTGGPPIVVYGLLRRWKRDRFRATLQGYFLFKGLIVIVGHGLAGLWNSEIFKLYGTILPVALVATLIGSKLSQYIPTQRFEKIIFMTFIVLGTLLLIQ